MIRLSNYCEQWIAQSLGLAYVTNMFWELCSVMSVEALSERRKGVVLIRDSLGFAFCPCMSDAVLACDGSWTPSLLNHAVHQKINYDARTHDQFC